MEINDSGGHLKIKFSNNDPGCGCLIGVKVRVNDNKDTNLSIHSSFAAHFSGMEYVCVETQRLSVPWHERDKT